MKVELIGKTEPILDSYLGIDSSSIVIHAATSQCYHHGDFDFQEQYGYEFPEPDTNLIKRVAKSGHTSILEHASASFHISGVSRALSHQLVRHRIASYTQQSQRYVNMEDFQVVTPETILNNPIALQEYNKVIIAIRKAYQKITKALIDNGTPSKSAKEDARYILPNGCTTQLVMTMNYRELGDFLGKRMCTRAQWEIREMAGYIFDIMSEIEPAIFGKDGVFKGVKCFNQGYCNEEFSCGLMKKL